MNCFGLRDIPLSILVIEDNYDDAELLEFQLDDLIKNGTKFDHSDSLASGLLRLEEGDVKIVLLDLTLPDSNGIATVISVRQSSPMIPIIVLTGLEDNQLAMQALAHGAQDYLIKGQITLPALCRSISYALARQSIVEVSDRLAAIVESSDDAIIGKTIKGTITSWNRGAERLFGYSASEASGQSLGMLMPPECIGELADMLARLSMGEVIHKETFRVKKDGQRVAVSETISPIRTNGHITGASAIERDVSERNRAEQELKATEKRLSLALKAAEVGVWDLDFAQNSVWRSLRHDEIFGHDSLLPAWNFGMFIEYVVPEDREYVHTAFQKGVKEGQFRMECRIVRASDKAVRWISSLGETFKDAQGKPIRMMGTVLDITDRKAQEEHDRLKAVLKEREDFMATLTHDMKNPLLGANRLLQLFADGSLGELTPKQRQLLRTLEQGNNGVLDLIANLTDVYRMEEKCDSLLIEDIDPAAIINSCIERIKCFAELRDITISAHLPAEAVALQADPKLVARVMHNLLDNALKFTPDKGAIELRLLTDRDNVVIEVEDNGAGIASQELPNLFKRFSQGGAGRRCSGGTGLGLYLCRQIAEAHGGTFDCQSIPDLSTVFRLSLPASASKLSS